MSELWTRLRFKSARDLAIAALIALGAGVVLDKVGPHASFDGLFVGMLLGLGLGLALFALGAYWRGRSDGKGTR